MNIHLGWVREKTDISLYISKNYDRCKQFLCSMTGHRVVILPVSVMLAKPILRMGTRQGGTA